MSHSRLSDPEYRNWITVGRAIQITRNGLESIIQNGVDNYHTSLLACATLPSNIYAWKSHLTKAHRSTDKRTICWWNSDNTQWLTAGASWEIAKIFMAPLGTRKSHVVSAKTTDISGLLNVLEWSPRGTSGIFSTGVSRSKLANARRARNLWAHATLLHTTDADKVKAFASFTSLLQDPELRHDKDVQYAINELSNLLKTGLVVIEENELEAIVQLQRQLGQDVVILGNNMNCWKDQVDATSKQIMDLKESLTEFVKKNELQNILETVQKKISDFEDQIVHELRSTNSRLDKLEENASAESQQFFYDRSELKFNPVCDRMKEEFVGREWLFTTIDSWLEKDLGPRESRAFLIWGGPGTGKSSFAQELVRRHENTLAGYHYCQKDNPRTCDLESLVYNLSRMLSKSLSEYAALIAGLERTADKFQDQPDKLFDLLITTPLQQLKENTKHFLFIDGMDEGGHEIASCFARLSATLPSWLRVILTARHNAPALTNLFPDSDFVSLDHFTASPQSLFANQRNIDEDIREFVSTKYRTLLSEYNYIPSFFENEQEGIEKIVEASQNCFLYAKLVMEHIFAGHDEISLPASLSEVYCLAFKRRFPDIEYFEKKVAPVLEIVLAIQCANAFVHKDMLTMDPLVTFHPHGLREYKLVFGMFMDGYQEGEEFVNGVVENGFLPGIRVCDLNKGLKLLSSYLVRNHFGIYYFTHSSVRDWLQDEKSDFFCDIRNGHVIMAAYNLKILKDKVPLQNHFVQDDLNFVSALTEITEYCAKRSYSTDLLKLMSFFTRYLFHSRYLPEPESSNVNVLITELGIEAIDLLHVAFDNMEDTCFLPFVRSESMTIEVLNETDVLNKMSVEEKAEHLELAIKSNCARIIAKFFGSARWIFSFEVLLAMTEEDIIEKCLQFVQENGSLPQLFYSYMCSDILELYFNVIVLFCHKHGAVLDVCFPEFCKNTKGFDSSTCWNEDVQEYFRKLKSGDKNVITLESLKEMPFYPEEARVSEFTLEIIQKPLSGSDCRFLLGLHGKKPFLKHFQYGKI